MNKKNSLINLGCRLNIYEGEIIKNHIKNNNIKNVTVINSCAVTAEAEKKVAYEIRKAKRINPENKIIVTGCAAQINPKKYHTLKEVDLVLGNKEKLLSDVWSELNFSKPIQVDDILLEKKTVPSTIEKFDLGNTIKVISFVEYEDGTTAKPKVLLEEKKNDMSSTIQDINLVSMVSNIKDDKVAGFMKILNGEGGIALKANTGAAYMWAIENDAIKINLDDAKKANKEPTTNTIPMANIIVYELLSVFLDIIMQF